MAGGGSGQYEREKARREELKRLTRRIEKLEDEASKNPHVQRKKT
jgi:hypothetical protein